MRSIKRQKKAGRNSSHLERTSLVNKGYYYRDKNLRRARWASSQSERRIHFILTARRFAQIVGQFVASATMPEICIRDNRPKISRKYYFLTIMPYAVKLSTLGYILAQARTATSQRLISSQKWAKRALMHEVVQRPSARWSLEVDLFRLNGFQSYYKFAREKNDWHMLSRERCEISLTVLLANCHEVTGWIFDRWISRQASMERPLKWHNQP